MAYKMAWEMVQGLDDSESNYEGTAIIQSCDSDGHRQGQ